MISRVTIYTLLATAMLGLGIKMWSLGQRDVCARYLAGDMRARSTETVEEGTRLVEVPCNQWLARQPMKVQVLCMADGVLLAIFLLNAAVDAANGFASQRRSRVRR